MKNNDNFTRTITRLAQYPDLIARVDGLLDVMENSKGDCIKARDAENRVTQELQQMGNDVLTSWASRQTKNVSDDFMAHENAVKYGKKNCIGIQNTEK
jgi:hypothetical protein